MARTTKSLRIPYLCTTRAWAYIYDSHQHLPPQQNPIQKFSFPVQSFKKRVVLSFYTSRRRRSMAGQPPLCACGFYGSSTTLNMCSKCYRDHLFKEATSCSKSATAPTTATNTIINEEPKAKVVASTQPRRCSLCQKRVGLTGFQCRCGATYCSLHRYPEKHGCSFDYKAVGREALAKGNPVVKADKVDKIPSMM